MLPAAQIMAVAGVMAMVGNGFTVTVMVALFWQPSLPRPVTVYVVVAVGLAVTVAPVVVARPVAGLQA